MFIHARNVFCTFAVLTVGLALASCQSKNDQWADASSSHDGAVHTDSATADSDMQVGNVMTISVVATNFNYDPQRLTVAPGEKVKIRLINHGSVKHNIEFELPSGEVEFEQPVPPGQSKTLTLTAPQKPGQYVVYCPVDNHRNKGMTATLIVQRGE